MSISDDLTLLCWVFVSSAGIVLILLSVAIWDFTGWLMTRRSKTRIVGGKKGQGGPFTL